LQFRPDHPARLKIEYLHADHDFNEDGVTTPRTVPSNTSSMSGGARDRRADWFHVGSVKFEDLDEIDANICRSRVRHRLVMIRDE